MIVFPRKDRLIDPAEMRVVPALRGRGTPPTKTVLRGSSGREASRTKSASDNFHGRICTGLSWIKREISHWTKSPICHASYHWKYLDCRRRNAEIEFIFLLHTRFDQLLDRVLFLNRKTVIEFPAINAINAIAMMQSQTRSDKRGNNLKLTWNKRKA